MERQRLGHRGRRGGPAHRAALGVAREAAAGQVRLGGGEGGISQSSEGDQVSFVRELSVMNSGALDIYLNTSESGISQRLSEH